MHCDVLIFVEDPGAANYVLSLPKALTALNRTVVLVAHGHAVNYLSQKDISANILTEQTTALQILQHYQPKVLVIGTSENVDSFGFDLVMMARNLGIVSIGCIDAYANAAYRFRGRSDHPLTYIPDSLLVPDEWIRQAYVDLGFPEEKIFICGHPYYDDVFKKRGQFQAMGKNAILNRFLPNFSDDNRLIVTFIAEISEGLNGTQFKRSNEYTLRGWNKSPYRTHIVLEEFLSGIKALNLNPYLVLRLHPKNKIDEFVNYLHFFDYISQSEPPHPLLYASDLVVGMASSLMMESYLLGTKTLSILPRECEQAWLPLIQSGIIPCATTQNEIQFLILDKLKMSSPSKFDDRFFIRGALAHMTKVIESAFKGF